MSNYAPYESGDFPSLGPLGKSKKHSALEEVEGREDFKDHVLKDEESSTEDVLQMYEKGTL